MIPPHPNPLPGGERGFTPSPWPSPQRGEGNYPLTPAFSSKREDFYPLTLILSPQGRGDKKNFLPKGERRLEEQCEKDYSFYYFQL